ncbi:ATP-binding protein [Ktedonospora formicarum]|uniref:Helicase HerA central domain-containing protein n=1 Tax=Ktedonospora formicarum TaxID=2778364 RepID=A0A8J3I0S1_9CHLR|nr:DUF87 domain-containing protein [Ktedonospora formicarum]GHO42789.1 hypothetical protein KSX_09520 [Ktedonospora formicarum]
MVPGFDVESLNKLGKLIAGLERYHLEGAAPETFDPVDLFDEEGQTFFHVRGLADFWSQKQEANFAHHVVDIVIGAHHLRQADLTFLLVGTGAKISIYISLGPEKTTRSILEGVFPGIKLEPVVTSELNSMLRLRFRSQGIMTGIPSRKAFDPNQPSTSQDQESLNTAHKVNGSKDQNQLERVIRGMHGASWAYLVQAHPRPRQKVVEERMRTVDLLTQITTRSHVQWSSTKQESQQFTSIDSGGQTKSFSGDMVNYRAQYLKRLLERELERLDQAAAAGQWIVHTYFGASNVDDTQRLASLLLGTLAGTDSRPEPLRVSLCEKYGTPHEEYHTFLSSQEVATLIQLPREEVPGYAIHDHVQFDVDFHASGQNNLPLGMIQHNGRDSQETFDISLDALTKHAVVIGVTGSGKTTTVMNLLDKAVEARKPFLVIEPAKTEYRALRNAFGDRANIRIYTLGSEMAAPFRLNPFEFEVTDEPGSGALMTHIDFLKAVFSAAFPMYAPLPQVLETSIYEIYEDKGWDVTSGTNRRLPKWSERNKYPIFPTLADLDRKAQIVADRLQYNPEADAHIKASLKARIGSLRIGAKGLMLDTTRGIPMAELLARPTILELEHIGNDDEKTFIMGLLLSRLYEYRRLQADDPSNGGNRLTGQGLRHLIVFEEAHRLLQNTGPVMPSNPDSANPRAQAVEVFTNMLSEIRAYGQGVLVAEQIPSKLAPDVLKNTNLKIAHRLIAQDDRISLGQTMNLTQAQLVHLGVLTPGQAVVYAEGADHSYLVRMENYKHNLAPLPDGELKRVSRTYASVKPFQFITDYEAYYVPTTIMGGPNATLYQAATKLLDTEQSQWLLANAMLCLVSNPAKTLEVLLQFAERIEAEMAYFSQPQQDVLLRMILVLGCAQTVQARGAQLGWPYPLTEELRVHLTHGLVGLVYAQQIADSQDDQRTADERVAQIQDILTKAETHIDQFVKQYVELSERRQGPFRGCVNCQARCLYRHDVRTLLTPRDKKWIYGELSNESYKNKGQRYEAVMRTASKLARGWIGGDETLATTGVGYCAVLHTIASADMSEYERSVASDDLQTYFANQNDEEDDTFDEPGAGTDGDDPNYKDYDDIPKEIREGFAR